LFDEFKAIKCRDKAFINSYSVICNFVAKVVKNLELFGFCLEPLSDKVLQEKTRQKDGEAKPT